MTQYANIQLSRIFPQYNISDNWYCVAFDYSDGEYTLENLYLVAFPIEDWPVPPVPTYDEIHEAFEEFYIPLEPLLDCLTPKGKGFIIQELERLRLELESELES